MPFAVAAMTVILVMAAMAITILPTIVKLGLEKLAGQNGRQLKLGVEFEPLTNDSSIKMNGQSGDSQDGAINLDQSFLELAITVHSHYPPGQAKISVKPGVP